MSGMNWDEITPEERLLAEQAVLNFRELNKAGDAAADGTVLNVCERMAIEQGREFTRRMLETSLHQQAQRSKKRGADKIVFVRIEQEASRTQGATTDHRRGKREAQPRVF